MCAMISSSELNNLSTQYIVGGRKSIFFQKSFCHFFLRKKPDHFYRRMIVIPCLLRLEIHLSWYVHISVGFFQSVKKRSGGNFPILTTNPATFRPTRVTAILGINLVWPNLTLFYGSLMYIRWTGRGKITPTLSKISVKPAIKLLFCMVIKDYSEGINFDHYPSVVTRA